MQKLFQNITGVLLIVLLAMLGVGCGGDSSGNSTASTLSNEVYLTARTGPIVAVRVGETTILDGSRSTGASRSSPSAYLWSFTSIPLGSNAVLQNPTTPNPGFVADSAGVYIAQLVVSDGNETSPRDLQMVVATVAPDPFTGPFNHQGLSTDCVNCHNGELDLDSRPGRITGKPALHLPASNTCQACHSPLGFTTIAFVDHEEIFEKCSTCHNGIIAPGKSSLHVPTNAECDACHNTDSFLSLGIDGEFDHTGIGSGCINCHNHVVATGPSDTNFTHDSITDCSACHNTNSFADAKPDHNAAAVTANRCDSCHGVTASAPITGHPVVALDCGGCHGTADFSMGGVFDHIYDTTLQRCDACHVADNVINAMTKSDAINHILTTVDCGNCHNTETFVDAYVDHTTDTVTLVRCDSCHNGVNAVGMISPPHLPTSEDCNSCHRPGSFATGFFNHDASYLTAMTCAACHDDVISFGKGVNHLPTTQDCGDCHDTVAFVPSTFNHSGITGNCVACHDGVITIGTVDKVNPAHIPVTQDCSACHVGFITFAGITYDHAGIDPNNCNSCHAAGFATGKNATHIPTAADCSDCHTTAGFIGATFDHGGVSRGCEGCHNGRFITATLTNVYGRPVGHLPTSQDCYFCHTTTAFTPAIAPFEHLGINNNCASCHDGSFNAVGAIGKPVDHIPVSQDCGACHATTSPLTFSNAFVDHDGADVTGKRCDSCHNGINAIGMTIPPHVDTTQDCHICHVAGGSFVPALFNHDGITENCASCHNGTDATGMTVPPHIVTSEDCSACHNTSAFAGASFDHSGIVGNCTACHDGNTATGKPARHVPTLEDCSICHVTTGFLPASFDHTGIVDNCSSCHGAGFATAKPVSHLATNEDCGACHNTTGFIPATFDHSGIVDNCASCHDGVTAVGMDAKVNPAHIPTTLDCSFCHTTSTFIGGSWDHQGISGGCTSCHDGTIAIGQQDAINHFVTAQECDTCHSTQAWAPTSFTHSRTGDYPGDHAVNLTCMSCHRQSNEVISYRYPAYAGSCAACHAGDYESGVDEHRSLSQDRNCANCHEHSVNKRGW